MHSTIVILFSLYTLRYFWGILRDKEKITVSDNTKNRILFDFSIFSNRSHN